jgi:hypothetical protein
VVESFKFDEEMLVFGSSLTVLECHDQRLASFGQVLNYVSKAQVVAYLLKLHYNLLNKLPNRDEIPD